MSAAGRSSGIGAGSMLAAARLDHPGARCRRGVGDAVGMEYVSRVPQPPLDGLIDDLYYLEGAPPYTPAGPIDPGRPRRWAGYFDQAHFGHEFRAFTGVTPTRYVEVRRRFLREHPGHALDGWPLPAD